MKSKCVSYVRRDSPRSLSIAGAVQALVDAGLGRALELVSFDARGFG
jgi:hypothetical protein